MTVHVTGWPLGCWPARKKLTESPSPRLNPLGSNDRSPLNGNVGDVPAGALATCFSIDYLTGSRRRLDVDAVAEDVRVPRREKDVLDVVAVDVVSGAAQRAEAVLRSGELVGGGQNGVVRHPTLRPQRGAVVGLIALGVGELDRGRALDRLVVERLRVLVQQRRRAPGGDVRVVRVGDFRQRPPRPGHRAAFVAGTQLEVPPRDRRAAILKRFALELRVDQRLRAQVLRVLAEVASGSP